jgi:hypothetical protein
LCADDDRADVAARSSQDDRLFYEYNRFSLVTVSPPKARSYVVKRAVDADKATTEPVIRRRGFLKAGAGLVGITIFGPPGLPTTEAAVPMTRGTLSAPGVARERIDGRAKVTGQKIFARDFNARNLGWGVAQWYAMYLPALTTGHAFLGVDLSILPPNARPARVVLGDHLGPGLRAPSLTRARDMQLEAVVAPAGSFDKPKSIEYDLIVTPGAVPNYLGQAVALLMFDTIAASALEQQGQ